MPPTTFIREANGSFIVREEEEGPIPIPITLESQESDLRAYEMRLRNVKAARARVKPLSAAQQNLAQKRAKIKAKNAREAREKESENVIRNLLAKGLQPSEIRHLFASLEEIDRNAAMWKYIESQVTKRNV